VSLLYLLSACITKPSPHLSSYWMACVSIPYPGPADHVSLKSSSVIHVDRISDMILDMINIERHA
jgi:hypothetical protein